jgi:hypothetical protein
MQLDSPFQGLFGMRGKVEAVAMSIKSGCFEKLWAKIGIMQKTEDQNSNCWDNSGCDAPDAKQRLGKLRAPSERKHGDGKFGL